MTENLKEIIVINHLLAEQGGCVDLLVVYTLMTNCPFFSPSIGIHRLMSARGNIWCNTILLSVLYIAYRHSCLSVTYFMQMLV